MPLVGLQYVIVVFPDHTYFLKCDISIGAIAGITVCKAVLVHMFSLLYNVFGWERSGSVVECLTRDRVAADSSLTGVTALWSLSKTQIILA